MISRLVSRCGTYVFGMCGLLLVLLVGKLAPYASPRQDRYWDGARAWLVRRGLDGIGAVVWLVDRLPPRVSSKRREPQVAGGRIDPRKV
jgi:hypothetical protein